jgi:alpha-1,3-rhamnosyl/mannosyltransferase
MRVLVNDLWARGTKTGIGHYTAQLVRALRASAADDRIESFPGPWITAAHRLAQRMRWHLQPEAMGKPVAGKTARSPGQNWRARWLRRARSLGWGLLAARLRSRAGAFDLYHEPNNIPLPADVPTVVTVHDLSVLLHPEWHPAHRVTDYEDRFRAGIARASHFFAVSEFTRQELIHHLGLRPDGVTRTYNGVRPGLGPMADDDVRSVLRRLRLPPRYFLYLGTVEPRKNVMTLLRAFVKLPAAVRERCPMVLAGGWGWNSADVAAFLDAEARHRGVVYLGYLPEADLPAVMNGARALVYPSFYEGFGLPPVEMLACGGAVLCSTAGALVETVGARAHLIEPLDEDGWRAALGRAAVDDEWVAELRRGAVEAARPFTWERCAADTWAGYWRAVGRQDQALPLAG